MNRADDDTSAATFVSYNFISWLLIICHCNVCLPIVLRTNIVNEYYEVRSIMIFIGHIKEGFNWMIWLVIKVVNIFANRSNHKTCVYI